MADVEVLHRPLRGGRLSRAKRAGNRMASTEILRQRRVAYHPWRDNPAHLVVRAKGRVADFFPGTGRYVFRREEVQGRGVFNLLRELGIEG